MKGLVLLVEDDLDIRESLECALEANGYEVIAARHGTEAIDLTLADGRRPAIILLDLQMPVMDGETFLATQPSQPLIADVPVVILTAQLKQSETPSRSVRAVLRKPAALSEVLELVHGACMGPDDLTPEPS